MVTDSASSTPAVTIVATTSIDGVPTLDLTNGESDESADTMEDTLAVTVIPDLVIPAFSNSMSDEATTSPGV
jgi:hypothetical protein